MCPPPPERAFSAYNVPNLPQIRPAANGSAGSSFGENMRLLPPPPQRGPAGPAQAASNSLPEQSTGTPQRSINLSQGQRVASGNTMLQTRPIPPQEQSTKSPQSSIHSSQHQRVESRTVTPQMSSTQGHDNLIEENPPEALTGHRPVLNPGSCARRLENLEYKTDRAKSELMRSISADISATFICIKQHIEAGTLLGDQTNVIEDAAQIIHETDIGTRRSLTRDVRRLRRDRNWSQKQYSKLTTEIDSLANVYESKVEELTKSLRETKGEVQQLREERDLLLASLRAKGLQVPQVNEEGDGGDRDEEHIIGEIEGTGTEVEVEQDVGK